MMGTNITTFANGMAFMFFIGAAYQIGLKGRKTRTKLILEVVLLLLALLELKDIIFRLSGIELPTFRKTGLFIDGLSVSAYTVYLFEMIRPGWLTAKKMIVLPIAYVCVILLCFVMTSSSPQEIFVLFIAVYAALAVLSLSFFSRRYIQEEEKVSRSTKCARICRFKKLFAALTVCIACWVAECVVPHPAWIRVVYELMSITLWGMILYDIECKPRKATKTETTCESQEEKEQGQTACEEKQTIREEQEETEEDDETMYPFREQLSRVMVSDVLYRNPHLTISDVANAIGTNRTYLSAYLNNVLHTTFYDYVNNYRIEHVSKKLLAEPMPNKTIEEIAELSGFNSMSTFRRAFIKNTGMTPLHFRKVAIKDVG